MTGGLGVCSAVGVNRCVLLSSRMAVVSTDLSVVSTQPILPWFISEPFEWQISV